MARYGKSDKQRPAHDEEPEVLEIIGHVEGRTAIVVDDFSISGGTLCEVAAELVARGAREVHVAVTHGVFATGTKERLEESEIASIVTTDSVETQPEPLSSKVEVVSVAPLFAEAIRRIHARESISVLFRDP
jgi:ribose-phosphate pyrophosphokinase